MRWFLLFVTSAVIINIGDAKEGDPPIGAAMNLLNQYGILIENIRAMRLYRFHVNNFEVPTVEVFKNPPQIRQTKGDSVLGSGWRLDFCDNVEQLLKYYCQNYQFDGVEKPWNVFTSFSNPIITADLFGINKSFVSDDFSYVVTSISRYRDGQEIAGSPENLEYDKSFVSEAENITVGDANSFIRFTNRVGTHYIHSFVTGESLYQVFVYDREFYKHFKELYKTPNTPPMSTDLLNEYLSPKHTLVIGLISSMSGDFMIEQWANNNMEVVSDGTYKSLFTVARNETLSKDLNERLEGNAVLELKLRSLAPFIKDPSRRQFFEELFVNYLTLSHTIHKVKECRPSLLFAVAFFITIQGSCSQKLPLGGAINMHARYGHLEETMRVMPMDDDPPSFHYEQIHNVVKDPTALPESARSLRISRLMEGRMQIKFCDTVKELLQFYFRYFEFDGIDEPWAAFRTNWFNNDTAKHFGINSSFIGSNYSYVLVKYVRFDDVQELATSPDNVRLVDNVVDQLEKLHYGNLRDLVAFYRNFGSHYISAYATGNAIYQVFVLVHPFYGVLKELIRKQGISKVSAYDMNLYFSPLYAVHIGSIQLASGNHWLDTWIIEKLRGQHTDYAYSSIMEVHRNPPLIRELRKVLQNEALLGLRLRSLSSFLSSPLEREWFGRHSADPGKEWQPRNSSRPSAEHEQLFLAKFIRLTNMVQAFVPVAP